MTRIALITFPSDEAARAFATRLVNDRLAACVNLVPGVTSVYRWQDHVRTDVEVLAIAKTRAEHASAIEALLRRDHPYDTPEFVLIAPEHVEPRYLAWWDEETRPQG